MGLFRRRSKIKVQASKGNGFDGWNKCCGCSEMVHINELEKNLNCCPKCDYHHGLSARTRIQTLVDKESFEELFNDLEPVDPLNFFDTNSYTERLEKAQKNAESNEAVITGTCTINDISVCLGVMNFKFMGGSMGSVVGERLTRLIEHSLETKKPLIIVTASGGARMQESIFSLMQMAKTSAALGKLHEAKVPYLTVLTNPTTGGVTASFATLADIIIAEPNALIGFAGPRVVEQTIRQPLPEGAQKSEFLLKNGMIDCITKRIELREKLSELLFFLTDNSNRSQDEKLAPPPKTFREKLQSLLHFARRKERNESPVH